MRAGRRGRPLSDSPVSIKTLGGRGKQRTHIELGDICKGRQLAWGMRAADEERTSRRHRFGSDRQDLASKALIGLLSISGAYRVTLHGHLLRASSRWHLTQPATSREQNSDTIATPVFGWDPVLGDIAVEHVGVQALTDARSAVRTRSLARPQTELISDLPVPHVFVAFSLTYTVDIPSGASVFSPY